MAVIPLKDYKFGVYLSRCVYCVCKIFSILNTSYTVEPNSTKKERDFYYYCNQIFPYPCPSLILELSLSLIACPPTFSFFFLYIFKIAVQHCVNAERHLDCMCVVVCVQLLSAALKFKMEAYCDI